MALTSLAVAYQDYPSFNRGVDADAFLMENNGSIFKGRVWPGVTAFPDWFHENTQGYWDDEFERFFSPTDGVDIDALSVSPEPYLAIAKLTFAFQVDRYERAF